MRAKDVLRFAEDAEARTGAKFSVLEENDMVHIKAKGCSAHAATPERGINALTALLDLFTHMPFEQSKGFDKLNSLVRLFPHGETDGSSVGLACADEKSGALTLAFSIFEYDDRGLRGRFDIRSPACATKEEVLDRLADKLEAEGIDMDRNGFYEPHVVSEDSSLVKTLLKVYSEQTGLKPYCISMGGVSYVHSIEGGVTFGCLFPGAENRMHGPDEFVDTDELLLNAKIFAHAIVELCR
jgi:succinyl-diaminopimelate desuccinylase